MYSAHDLSAVSLHVRIRVFCNGLDKVVFHITALHTAIVRCTTRLVVYSYSLSQDLNLNPHHLKRQVDFTAAW